MLMPRDFTPYAAYEARFGGSFFCLEPDGGLIYEMDGKELDLRQEEETQVLNLLDRGLKTGRNLIFETYQDQLLPDLPPDVVL